MRTQKEMVGVNAARHVAAMEDEQAAGDIAVDFRPYRAMCSDVSLAGGACVFRPSVPLVIDGPEPKPATCVWFRDTSGLNSLNERHGGDLLMWEAPYLNLGSCQPKNRWSGNFIAALVLQGLQESNGGTQPVRLDFPCE